MTNKEYWTAFVVVLVITMGVLFGLVLIDYSEERSRSNVSAETTMMEHEERISEMTKTDELAYGDTR